MMGLVDGLAITLLLAGGFFFLAGTVGLLRFPDVYNRLHALTKADNTGLGLIAVGLALTAETFSGALKLLLIWVLVLMSSAGACHLIARTALKAGIETWRKS